MGSIYQFLLKLGFHPDNEFPEVPRFKYAITRDIVQRAGRFVASIRVPVADLHVDLFLDKRVVVVGLYDGKQALLSEPMTESEAQEKVSAFFDRLQS